MSQLHEYLVEKLKNKANLRDGVLVLSRKQARRTLSYVRIARDKQVAILEELNKKGYIKINSKDKVILRP